MRFLILVLVVFACIKMSLADDFPTDIKSPEVKEAIKSFEQMKKSTTTLVTEKIRTYRQELIDKLKDQQKTVTMAGDLEEALKIKSLIGQLEAVQAASTELVVEEGEKVAGKISIPRGAVKFGNSRYYVVTEPATWHVARVKCGLAGGHLLRIDSEDEMQFIKKFLSPLSTDSESEWLFIDGNDEWEMGTFLLTNGEPIPKYNWAPSYPKDEDVRHFLVISSKNGLIANESSFRHFYICEWE